MYKSGLFKKLFVILDEHYQFCMSKKKHLMIGCSVSNQLNTKFEYLLSVIIANCGCFLLSTVVHPGLAKTNSGCGGDVAVQEI